MLSGDLGLFLGHRTAYLVEGHPSQWDHTYSVATLRTSKLQLLWLPNSCQLPIYGAYNLRISLQTLAVRTIPFGPKGLIPIYFVYFSGLLPVARGDPILHNCLRHFNFDSVVGRQL